MGIGDYVWFRMVDDACARGEFRNILNKEYRVGKIIKKTTTTNPHLVWVTTLPVERIFSVPLWAIPVNLAREISDEEAMLHILEG